MGSGADVNSIDSLRDFSNALARFTGRVEEALRTAESSVAKKIGLLEGREDQQRRNIQNLRASLQDAENEEEYETILQDLDDAADRLKTIRHWKAEAEAGRQAYQRQAHRIRELTGAVTPQARGFLERKVGELQSYIALTLQLDGEVAHIESHADEPTGNEGKADVPPIPEDVGAANAADNLAANTETPGILSPICPLEVFDLPDGSIQVGRQITIRGTPQFRNEALTVLREVAKLPTGREVLKVLDSSKHTVTLRQLDSTRAQEVGAFTVPTDPKPFSNPYDPSVGSLSNIYVNPHATLALYDKNNRIFLYPPAAIFAHELIHALHDSKGVNRMQLPDPHDRFGNQEESSTIGINDFADSAFTENQVLKELGLGYRRIDHDSNVEPI